MQLLIAEQQCVADPQVIAHMMPDLPNVGWERDMESFREFFENPAFRSDGLKVHLASALRTAILLHKH